ncbi:serine/arginine repetitive matrix protein 1-like [Onychomys torridus]|uniref:serine/arginine repetitive matrix protein 1-like n=1 Tax=Onychomys torridus TaxID=38674 RepID=UPI00167FD450|nr:serine/arginine repetitive matrix protein 1-like [Onychomys torridus]
MEKHISEYVNVYTCIRVCVEQQTPRGYSCLQAAGGGGTSGSREVLRVTLVIFGPAAFASAVSSPPTPLPERPLVLLEATCLSAPRLQACEHVLRSCDDQPFRAHLSAQAHAIPASFHVTAVARPGSARSKCRRRRPGSRGARRPAVRPAAGKARLVPLAGGLGRTEASEARPSSPGPGGRERPRARAAAAPGARPRARRAAGASPGRSPRWSPGEAPSPPRPSSQRRPRRLRRQGRARLRREAEGARPGRAGPGRAGAAPQPHRPGRCPGPSRLPPALPTRGLSQVPPPARLPPPLRPRSRSPARHRRRHVVAPAAGAGDARGRARGLPLPPPPPGGDWTLDHVPR